LAKLAHCAVNNVGRAFSGTVKPTSTTVGLLYSGLISFQRALNALV
jgi:hypothetical protein